MHPSSIRRAFSFSLSIVITVLFQWFQPWAFSLSAPVGFNQTFGQISVVWSAFRHRIEGQVAVYQLKLFLLLRRSAFQAFFPALVLCFAVSVSHYPSPPFLSYSWRSCSWVHPAMTHLSTKNCMSMAASIPLLFTFKNSSDFSFPIGHSRMQ